uniref:Cathepsin propeptide inhibitor domain-containing protein n=1 Tax=Suricata suricatta TaxID=37032 RepID=A0A673TNY2_SURSU
MWALLSLLCAGAGLLGPPACGAADFYASSLEKVHFKSWMVQHRKTYSSEEYQHRLQTFVGNWRRIRAHNAGNHTFKMALNQFSDMSFAEIKHKYLWSEPQNCSATRGNYLRGTGPYPPFVDWRKKGKFVSPVKNQVCGAAPSFPSNCHVHRECSGRTPEGGRCPQVCVCSPSPEAGRRFWELLWRDRVPPRWTEAGPGRPRLGLPTAQVSYMVPRRHTLCALQRGDPGTLFLPPAWHFFPPASAPRGRSSLPWPAASHRVAAGGQRSEGSPPAGRTLLRWPAAAPHCPPAHDVPPSEVSVRWPSPERHRPLTSGEREGKVPPRNTGLVLKLWLGNISPWPDRAPRAEGRVWEAEAGGEAPAGRQGRGRNPAGGPCEGDSQSGRRDSRSEPQDGLRLSQPRKAGASARFTVTGTEVTAVTGPGSWGAHSWDHGPAWRRPSGPQWRSVGRVR